MAFESFKHLATLNAGSIVLIGTFLKGIFPTQDGSLDLSLGIKVLIAASFVAFGGSLLFAVLVMLRSYRLLEEYVGSPLDLSRYEHARVRPLFASLATWLFFAGLVCFGGAVVVTMF